MPTTSNFGWTTPADTDLVKDGAAAIRTLGNGIDTSFLDLKGGTTGQVLSKASNTDLDFSWVAQDDSNAIQNALLTTTGDTIYASGASTPARLAIGSAGQVLTVSGGVPTWASPAASGAYTSLASGTITNGSTELTFSSISASYTDLLLVIRGWSNGSNSVDTYARVNNESTAYYSRRIDSTTINSASNTSSITVVANSTASVTNGYLIFRVNDYANTTGAKLIESFGMLNLSNPTFSWGFWNGTGAINRITIFTDGTYDGGTYILYGVK